MPFLVVGKEISLEDVRLTLEKLPDRFSEHPQTVVVLTNMHYREAPALQPAGRDGNDGINWREIALEGHTAHEFDRQINELRPLLADRWKVQTSPSTGNPVYVEPSAIALYRSDHRFTLDSVIPRPGTSIAGYDLVIAAQPFRARHPAERKVRLVLAPLAASLAPSGRMITIQATGQDPGMEIIRRVWPNEDPFRTPGPVLIQELRARLAARFPDREFNIDGESHSFFRYSLHVMPNEVIENIGTSTRLAAWNAAVYVAQIDDDRVTRAMSEGAYLEATADVVTRHGGLCSSTSRSWWYGGRDGRCGSIHESGFPWFQGHPSRAGTEALGRPLRGAGESPAPDSAKGLRRAADRCLAPPTAGTSA